VQHASDECPDRRPPLTPLQPMTQDAIDELNAVIRRLWREWSIPHHRAGLAEKNHMGPQQEQRMQRFRNEVRAILQSAFGNSIRLDLFGSSTNGFGFRFSDVDLCMRFAEDSLPLVRGTWEMDTVVSVMGMDKQRVGRISQTSMWGGGLIV
jgi:hypothetical protein